jgi:hypothetical protein
MSSPAFIVDGFTEMKIVQKICPNTPVQRTDLNGKDVTLDAISNNLSRLIKPLINRYYPIVILVDKEDRNITCEEMESVIFENLKKNFPDQDLRVGVADRMIENWMIADWVSFCNNSAKKPTNTDGLNGTAVIKKIKGSYSKTADGVNFFVNNNPHIMYENSLSYRCFIDKLKDLNCYYTNQFKE